MLKPFCNPYKKLGSLIKKSAVNMLSNAPSAGLLKAWHESFKCVLKTVMTRR